jgi:hypothetical protein
MPYHQKLIFYVQLAIRGINERIFILQCLFFTKKKKIKQKNKSKLPYFAEE